MAEIRRENQLRLVVHHIIYRVFLHPRWLAGFLNHQQYKVEVTSSFCVNILDIELINTPFLFIPISPITSIKLVQDKVHPLYIYILPLALQPSAWRLSQVLPGQLVSAIPELRLVELDLTLDRFVVLACDGIWDVLQELDSPFFWGSKVVILGSKEKWRLWRKCTGVLYVKVEGEKNLPMNGEEPKDLPCDL